MTQTSISPTRKARAFAEELDAINLEAQQQGPIPAETVARLFAEHEARCLELERAEVLKSGLPEAPERR